MGNHLTVVRLPARLALVALLAAAAPALLAAPASAAALHAPESASLSAAAGLPPLTPQPTAQPRTLDNACPADHVPDAGFGDVPAANPHKLAIDCVKWWGVAQGRTKDQYAPTANVTRAQMATFIANALSEVGADLPQPTRDYFSDDDGLGVHEDNINLLAESGIINGRSPGVYAPFDPVGRGAMTKFLVNSYETSGDILPTSKDYFSDDNGTQFERYINAAASVGIASGNGGQYRPVDAVRRDQMASFVARWLDLVVERLLVEEQ
jgi:hypothetical protein